MTLDEVKARTTHRQYLAWIWYLDDQWGRPSRSDNYLMQIAFEVCRGNAAEPNKVKRNSFKIPFTRKTEKPKAVLSAKEKKKRVEWAKARWLGIVKFKG